MPLNLPSSPTFLKPKDPEAQRYLQQAERSVNPVLQFLRSSFDNAQNGALKIIRSAVLQSLQTDNLTAGAATVTGATNLNGPATLGGPTTLNGATTAAGVTNLNGGVNTPTGFKTTLGQFGVSGSLMAATTYDLGTAFYSSAARITPPFSGSLVGATINYMTNAAMTITVKLRNFTPADYTYNFSAATGGSITTSFTVPRNTYTFSSASILFFTMTTPAMATFNFTLTPIVEFTT